MEKFVIGLTGLPGSGKTTIAKKIIKKYAFNLVSSDEIREFIIKKIEFYKNAEYSHPNKLFSSLDRIREKTRDALIEELTRQGQSLIIDSCGKTKSQRFERINLAKKFDPEIKTIIIHFDLEEKTIKERLSKRSSPDKWLNSHKIWKEEFEIPTKDEADFILNYDENLFESLDKIIK